MGRNRPSALWIGAASAFVVLGVLAAVRAADWTYGAQTGSFVQTILDPFGRMHGIDQATRHRVHWSPDVLLLWPLLAATRSVWALQTAVAAATVACAPLLAAIARERGLTRGAADRVGAVALVYPPLVAVACGELGELALLPPLVLGWWLALKRRSWRWVAITAALLAGLREDVCLELAVLGIAVAIAEGRRGDPGTARGALTSAGMALVSGAIYLLAVLPRAGPWPPHAYENPVTAGPFAYVLEAVVPLALVAFRTRLAWLAVPGFAIVMLAHGGTVSRAGAHDAALWFSWLLIAFAAGVATTRRQRRWTSIPFALSALVLLAVGPAHALHDLRPSYHALGDARAVLAAVPERATVATHAEWYTSIAARRPGASVLGIGPHPYDAMYVVFATDYPDEDFQRRVLPRIRAVLTRERYRVVARIGAVAAYERPEAMGENNRR